MATRSMPFWPRPATTSGSSWPGSGLCAPFSGRLSWSGITRAAPLPHPPEHANSLFHRRLAMPFTLPHTLPPLRLLLVWDNLAGHKTPDLVLWLCEHGVMPLYTPVGGSWLNMAESIDRVLKRRALDGQHPHSPDEIGSWFEQTARNWNEQPTPFVWNGKRRQRRRRSSGA